MIVVVVLLVLALLVGPVSWGTESADVRRANEVREVVDRLPKWR